MPSRSRKRREYKYARMHASKREFPTFEQASNAANLIFRRTHEQMVPYKCEFCAGFHIGHQREEYR